LFDLSPGIDNDVGAIDDRTAVAGGSTRSSASAAAISLSLPGTLRLARGITLLLEFSDSANGHADCFLSTAFADCARATVVGGRPPGRREAGNIDDPNTETPIAVNDNQSVRRRMMRRREE